jgi:hypothetical protein
LLCFGSYEKKLKVMRFISLRFIQRMTFNELP